MPTSRPSKLDNPCHGKRVAWLRQPLPPALLPRSQLRNSGGSCSRPCGGSAGGISEEVAKWVAQGNKWSKSTIAAEQARRGRKGLPALNNAEMSALLGEPVEATLLLQQRLRRQLRPHRRLPQQKLPVVPSARKLQSGLRKERSGASPRSLRSRPGVDAKVYRRSPTLKFSLCWENLRRKRPQQLRLLQQL